MGWFYGYLMTIDDGQTCSACKNLAQFAFSPDREATFRPPHKQCTNSECRCCQVFVDEREQSMSRTEVKHERVRELLRQNDGMVRLSEIHAIMDELSEDEQGYNFKVEESRGLVDTYVTIRNHEKDDPQAAIEKYTALMDKYRDSGVFDVAGSYFTAICDRVSQLAEKGNPELAMHHMQLAEDSGFLTTKGDRTRLEKRRDRIRAKLG